MDLARRLRVSRGRQPSPDTCLYVTHGPFDTGPDSVMVAFASNAELACFLALGWPFPTNVLDPYVENIVTINGNTAVWPPADEKKRKGRPGLLDSLKLHDLPARPQEHKDRMRDMILDNEDYTPEQRREIQDYNQEDVDDTIVLLDTLGSPSMTSITHCFAAAIWPRWPARNASGCPTIPITSPNS